MKMIITIFMIFTFIIVGAQYPNKAYAGKGDPPSPSNTVVFLALIGGAAYLGYYYGQHYEVRKKKGLLSFEDGAVTLQQPTLHVEASRNGRLMTSKARYSLNLLNVNY
ncbi:MAG: hypothetical protein OEV42_20695 [Deltaproteobacteria bacterium]|nr:hypothetical protein [Deltaproteobacteria bacterium]